MELKLSGHDPGDDPGVLNGTTGILIVQTPEASHRRDFLETFAKTLHASTFLIDRDYQMRRA